MVNKVNLLTTCFHILREHVQDEVVDFIDFQDRILK